VTVEEDSRVAVEESQKWHACAELVDEEVGRSEGSEVGGEKADAEEEVELAHNGAEYGEPTEQRARY